MSRAILCQQAMKPRKNMAQNVSNCHFRARPAIINIRQLKLGKLLMKDISSAIAESPNPLHCPGVDLNNTKKQFSVVC